MRENFGNEISSRVSGRKKLRVGVFDIPFLLRGAWIRRSFARDGYARRDSRGHVAGNRVDCAGGGERSIRFARVHACVRACIV